MMLPPVDLRPPLNITRASHVRITVGDLAESRDFYTNVMGLVVTEEDESACYLRALAEACHHSLVLERGDAGQTSRRIGFRVFLDEDLDAAYRYFRERDLPAQWVDEPHQGRTLQVSDPAGTPLELCATMETRPRLYTDLERYKGAAAQQLDHFQILVPDVDELIAFYGGLGFRNSEYIGHAGVIAASFLYRKNTMLDLAVFKGSGPRLHHFAYTVAESRDLFSACDWAGRRGYPKSVERGPGRHGPGGILFVYLRDPDGHRVEAFINHYAAIDVESEPVAWDAAVADTSVRWGLPAVEKWYFEASEFAGVPVTEPDEPPHPMTLERYLLETAAGR